MAAQFEFRGTPLLSVINRFGPVLRRDLYLYFSRLDLVAAKISPVELLGYLNNRIRLERYMALTDYVENDFYKSKYQIFLRTIFSTLGPHFTTQVARMLSREPTVFNVMNARIVQYISEVGLDKAVRLTQLRQASLRMLIDQVADLELTYEAGLRLMQSTQVITPKMAEALGKYYRKQIEGGATVEEALALTKVKSEAAKRWRSGVQIGTELNRAKNEADIQSLKQMRMNGLFMANERIFKLWQRTQFQDNHQNSIDNDGVMVELDEPFPDGSMYPSEYHEKCRLSYVVEQTQQGFPPALDIIQPTPATFPLQPPLGVAS